MADHPKLIDASQQRAAKVAGLAYLIPVAFVLVANFGIRARIFVAGDMAATVRNIAAAQPLFRLSVVFDLVYCIGVVVLLAALYVVLSPVSRYLALLATLLKLMYAVTAALLVLSLLTMVGLAGNPAYLQGLTPAPLQALVRLESAGTFNEYYVGLAFWALASTTLGWLWLKSRYVPAALAGFGLVASAWCTLCTFAYLIDPAFSRVVNLWWFDTPMALFDIALSFWLLFKGLRSPPARATALGV